MKNQPLTYDRMAIHLARHLNLLLPHSTVPQLRKWLQLSESSIYNKLSGRSRFTFEELVIICRQAGISMDQLIHMDNDRRSLIPFHMDALMYPPRTYAEYLKNITNHFYKLKTSRNVQGLIIAHEIPLFYLLIFPHLLYLKMYFWNRLNWKIKDLPAFYDPSYFISDPEVRLNLRILNDLFLSFPHTEIWHPNILDNTISQFYYLSDLKLIKDDNQRVEIIREFNCLVQYLEKVTESGLKPENSKGFQCQINVLLSGISTGPETILVKSDDLQTLFIQTEIPNYIKTTDLLAIEKFHSFFRNVCQLSTQITQSGDKEKQLFFSVLKEKIKSL